MNLLLLVLQMAGSPDLTPTLSRGRERANGLGMAEVRGVGSAGHLTASRREPGARPSRPQTASLDPEVAGRFARLALDCVHREYPNKIAHVLAGEADVRPPRQLTPVFYGCYDWHSAVHGHWLLARLARSLPGAAFAPRRAPPWPAA